MRRRVPAWLRRNGAVRTAGELIRRYNFHDVGQQSAAMAYYLLFTIFPMLIFLSSLLGILKLDVEAVRGLLAHVLPKTVLDLCETYLQYVSHTASATILGFSLVFSIYFPMRAANCLVRCVRRAYGLRRPERPVRYRLRLLVFTLYLIVVIVAALALMTLGEKVLLFFVGHMELSQGLLRIWNSLRFVILALLLFATLGILYGMSQDRRQPALYILPGALCALVAWMLLSVGFSFYVENFANYSVIYGTLGAVIVLLVWLFLSAATLIMGAEVNGMIQQRHLSRRSRPEEGGYDRV